MHNNDFICKVGLPKSFGEEYDSFDFLSPENNYGIWHLTLTEIAKLMALEMWFAGEIKEVKAPDDFDGSFRSPALIALLKNYIDAIVHKLQNAVDSGRLKAASWQRKFDESLVPEVTFINYDELRNYVNEIGFFRGRINCNVFDMYSSLEADIESQICEKLVFYRTQIKSGDDKSLRITLDDLYDEPEAKLSDVRAALNSSANENRRLREQLAAARSNMHESPLPTRSRRTLLVIIAALCERSKIDISARGAAQRIKELTEELGVQVDIKTISTILVDLPEALEFRMKG